MATGTGTCTGTGMGTGEGLWPYTHYGSAYDGDTYYLHILRTGLRSTASVGVLPRSLYRQRPNAPSKATMPWLYALWLRHRPAHASGFRPRQEYAPLLAGTATARHSPSKFTSQRSHSVHALRHHHLRLPLAPNTLAPANPNPNPSPNPSLALTLALALTLP